MVGEFEIDYNFIPPPPVIANSCYILIYDIGLSKTLFDFNQIKFIYPSAPSVFIWDDMFLL